MENETRSDLEIYRQLKTGGCEVKKPNPGKRIKRGLNFARDPNQTTFNSTGVYQYQGASVSDGHASIRGIQGCPCLEFVGEEGLLSVVNGFISSMVERGLERNKFLKRKIKSFR